VVAALLLQYLAGPWAAFADDTYFEIDRDASDCASVIGDDWSCLYDGVGNASIFSFKSDPGQDSVYVGGRKDIQDLPDWGWKNNGGFPDKDDITNAYASAYFEDGDLVLYFGCDRFANNGDAYLGFWFFQDHVSCNPNGTFTGSHRTGDILVLVNYPQASNASPQIKVVEWNPAKADVAKNLHLIKSGAECVDGTELACALTNMVNTNSPWPYTPKSGSQNLFPYESFYEGRINLSKLVSTVPCITSFMAESRSSQMFTATLKDFVIDDFPVCAIDITKQCDVVRLTDQNDNTDKFFVVNFSGSVTNDGAGSLPKDSNLIVVDDAGTPNNSSDDVVIPLILDAPLAVGASVPFTGRFFSNENPPHNTITASLEANEIHLEANYDITCSNLLLDPNLSVSKLCWTRLKTIDSLLAIEVLFAGSVTNSGNVPLLVTVTDDKAGVVLEPSLVKPGQTKMITGSYLPLSANGDVNQPCIAVFSDTFTADANSPIPGVNQKSVKVTANCPLCGDCD
jgi:hypothetical protein